MFFWSFLMIFYKHAKLMWERKMVSSKASRNETAPKHSLKKVWELLSCRSAKSESANCPSSKVHTRTTYGHWYLLQNKHRSCRKNITIHKGLTTPTRSKHFTKSQNTNPDGNRFFVEGQNQKLIVFISIFNLLFSFKTQRRQIEVATHSVWCQKGNWFEKRAVPFEN